MSEKSKFSGHFGFVMAAAGSAVGVGNLWRFPYLAAKERACLSAVPGGLPQGVTSGSYDQLALYLHHHRVDGR